MHLATVPFRPEEGVSCAVTSLAGMMPGVESHLSADNPVGLEFADHHTLPDWKPVRVVTDERLRRILNTVEPDIVHLHGGVLATSLALSPALRRFVVVSTVYQLLPVPRSELGLHQFFDARRSSIRPGRIIASAITGLPIARSLLKRGGIEVVCTPDPRVAAALDRLLASDSSPQSLASALANVLKDQSTWEQLSQGARTTIETDWSWANAAKATANAYDIALQRRADRLKDEFERS